MTLKDKICSQFKQLKELMKFLTNSKHRLFIFSLWFFSIISLTIFPNETINNEDSILGRISVASRVFFFLYTVFYMILILSNSNKESLDINSKLTSRYSYLVYIILFVLLIFSGMLIDGLITICFILIILCEPVFFLVLPSSLLMKYIEKRNKLISHPSFYIGIILFTSLFVIGILTVIKAAAPQFNFGAFEISFGLIIVGLLMVIITVFFLVIKVIISNLDKKSKHIKMIFILLITIVALVMIVYRLIIYVLNYEFDVFLNSLSIGLLIFKDLLLIFIVFSIELNEAGDINDKSRSDKTYLYILLIQTFMLYEKRVYGSFVETNTTPMWYPDLIIPFIVIPAIIYVYIELNKRYKKNPNALIGLFIQPQQKTNRYRIICIVIIIAGLFAYTIIVNLILLSFQR